MDGLLWRVARAGAAAGEHTLHVGGKDVLLLHAKGASGCHLLGWCSLIGDREHIEHERCARQRSQVRILAQCLTQRFRRSPPLAR